MRKLLTPASGAPVRFGRRLLLAFALCACGRGGDADGGSGATNAPEAGTASAQADADACTEPPVIDPALFTGRWDVLVAALRERGATFPDVQGNRATATLPLCTGCDNATLELRSDTTTYCTQPDGVKDARTRILGLMVMRDSLFPAQKGWGNIRRNDSIFMFASGDTMATLVYRQGDNATTAPPGSWAFYYCQDTHRGNRPQAQWRPRGKPPVSQTDKGKQEEANDGGTYGWMACASGCCQFYTPPPNQSTDITTPAQANPNAPDTVGKGHNASPDDPGRPYWCTGT